MTDKEKAAVERLRDYNTGGPVIVEGKMSLTESCVVLADAYLAELDETSPSPELLKPLGFVEKDGEWSIRIPTVRMILSWSPSDVGSKEPGDFPMPHTMGQVRTLLRVFGVKEGEKK